MASSPRFAQPLFRWLVKLRVLLITAVLLLATYAAAGFWWVPRLVTSLVHDTFSERYQREVRLGVVTSNPFTLELSASDFYVPDADGAPLLSFERLYVNVGIVSLFRGGLSFQQIRLDKPRVHLVRRADGALNLSDFAGPPEPEAQPEENEPPPKLWIDDLAISDGQTTVVDRDRPQPLTLELGPITFQVRKFSTRNEGNEYMLAVQSAHGDELTWRGDFGLSPLASHGKFTLRNIQVQTLAEIAAELVPFQVTRGLLAADGSYAFGGRGKSLSLHVNVAQFFLDNVGLRAHGDTKDSVSLPHLSVMDTQLDLSTRTLKVAHVTLDQLQVSAVRESGRLSLQRLMPVAQAQPEPVPASEPWTIEVPDIMLRGAELELEDRRALAAAHLRLAPLDLNVNDFRSPATGPLRIELKTSVNQTGRFVARGELSPESLSGSFEIDATAIPLVPLQPYVDESAAFNLKSGNASIQATVSVSAQRAVELDGHASIEDLATTDKELEEDFVKWSSLKLTGLKVQSEPLSLRIADVVVTEPYARVIIGARGAINIQDVLSPRMAAAQDEARAAAPNPAAPSKEAEPLPIEIEQVRIERGSMNFADLSIKPSFETGIQELTGTIKGLSARPDARANVFLEGQVDRYTPVKITGKVNYFAAVSYTDLRMAFRNLELTSMSPYSGKFAGYRIERGKLNVTLDYLIKKRKLNAKHKIVIDQLQLGDRVNSPDATSLPVKLAIALLKDRNGVIDLDIPVSGNLDDPKFKVWPIIWQVVGNLLTKIVTSPFALLGSLFGASDEISYVEFAPGSAALSAASTAKLQTLAKALSSRPSLNLDLPLTVKPDADAPALLAQHWREERERLARRRAGARAADPQVLARLLAAPKEYRPLLEGAYLDAYGKKPAIPQPAAANAKLPANKTPAPVPDWIAIGWLEQQLRAKIAIGQSDIDALARERAQKVQGIILEGTGIDPSRVFVITAPPLAKDAALRMQLALH